MDLKTVSVEALSSVLTFVKQSGEFVKEQAPMLAQEIVKYELVSSLGAVLGAILLLILSFFLFKISLKMEPDGDFDFPSKGFSVLGSIILAIAMIITITVQGQKSLKAYTAPRLVVIEKISELIK